MPDPSNLPNQASHPKLIVFAGPSGAGKTTLVRHFCEHDPRFSLSVSATTRSPRGQEKNGQDYYFLTEVTFKEKIKNDEFLEYEEVYQGLFYGTLKTEVQRLHDLGKTILLDLDVIGSLNLKKIYQEHCLTVFVSPPSREILEKRLRARATETEEKIQQRLAKSDLEMSYMSQFDIQVVNNEWNETIIVLDEKLKAFLSQ